MPSSMDELSPSYIGEDRIQLSLTPFPTTPAPTNTAVPGYSYPAVSPQAPVIRAFHASTIFVDYTDCAPDGLVLPLELIIRGPSPGSYQRRVYRRRAPSSTIVFVPREGGQHFVMLREVAHNRWWGRINFDVVGQLLSPRRS